MARLEAAAVHLLLQLFGGHTFASAAVFGKDTWEEHGRQVLLELPWNARAVMVVEVSDEW